MKKVLFLFVLATFFVSCVKEDLDQTAVLNQESVERGATVPFRADFVVYPTSIAPPPILELDIPGEGNAIHMGKVTLASHSFVYFTTPPPFAQTGDMVITAADGATLIGTFEGFSVPDPDTPNGFSFSGTISITGGTGRLEGYTGSGTYTGSAVEGTPSGLGDLHFEGTLTKP
jgi:hypothetical protein